MNEPRGPLSPSVYRRRRVMAMAGLGVGALLFIWAVGALLGGDENPAVRGTANVRPDGVPPLTTTQVSNPPATGPIAQPGGPSSSAPASASANATASHVPTTSASVTTTPATTTTAVPTTTTTTPTTATPAAPVACPDSAVSVTVTTGKPSYPSGSRPVLTLHIANAGKVSCVRDVSHQLRSIEVLAIGNPKPVWLSSYCYSLNTHEIHTFKPGESLSYTIQWAGRTAAPGCPVQRTTVPAGKYEVIGRLGSLAGKPTPLTLT